MHKNHSLPTAAGIVLTLLFLANAPARADLIHWGYNWEPSATKVAADGGGNGFLALTDAPSKAASGSSNTVVTNLRAFSTASSSSPDTFTHANYAFTLQLQDSASQATGSLSFTGFFSGTLTGNNANIKLNPTSPTSQQITLGGNVYTVTLGTYTPPGPPDATNAGSLNAVVSVAPSDGNGHISSAPEPSSLLLAGLAFPCLGLTIRRKRRPQSRMA